YLITAKATDNIGASAWSDPVHISVGGTPTNHPPYVRLNQPMNGASFVAPTNIRLSAFAQDAEDGYTLKVEFFEGTNSLGLGTFVPSVCPTPFCPSYDLIWSNVSAGTYTLTAKATDSAGATSSTEPIHIYVKPPSEVPIVTIRATDGSAS